ncbi:MAG: ATP-dependent DNA helicase [Eubacterium sp.]|nr:ATP-dependent DNA helicase [Eubacterium sp.]
MKTKTDTVKISVRNLVEFILREGDITTSETGGPSVELMQMGSRIHRKIQKSMGPGYEAEVPLSTSVSVKSPDSGDKFTLTVEGRADGIMRKDGILVDEIKGVMHSVKDMEAPDPIHLAQAMCYAYMILEDEPDDEITVQITYCHMETERIRRFTEKKTRKQIRSWFKKLINKYKPWAIWTHDHEKQRNASIDELDFPYEFRPGQKELIAYTYKQIADAGRLFIQAPTGVGKTISTVFPSVKAMGEGKTERIFYLTAKTITRTVAEDCFSLLTKNDLTFMPITLTAKEKLCMLDKPACNPTECPRAKGHYDRVNDALYELITKSGKITRETINEYASQYNVCPFELSLDAAMFCDAIICDYNYVFDPNVRLKRFFGDGRKTKNILLIDEAHNLVDRAREMYSASIIKEDFLSVAKAFRKEEKKENRVPIKSKIHSFILSLESINKSLLELKKNSDGFTVINDIGSLSFKLYRSIGKYDDIFKIFAEKGLPERDKTLELYFLMKNFVAIYDELDENYRIYTDYDEDGNFRLTLGCMEPGDKLKEICEKVTASVFFSATLLPIRYYKQQLGGEPSDPAVYATSSFPPENRNVIIAKDVTSLYKKRSPEMYARIATYIEKFIASKFGNYLIFFPSYAFLDEVSDRVNLPDKYNLLIQDRVMRESDREDFLSAFNAEGTVGLCVMGGIFSEGIDLPGDKLIGTTIVGTGLPMVCDIRELYRSFYEEKYSAGFDYAYKFPGLSKVLQAGGRVIRTDTDRGVILLLDDRFIRNEYRSHFPREWSDVRTVTIDDVEQELWRFWGK